MDGVNTYILSAVWLISDAQFQSFAEKTIMKGKQFFKLSSPAQGKLYLL